MRAWRRVALLRGEAVWLTRARGCDAAGRGSAVCFEAVRSGFAPLASFEAEVADGRLCAVPLPGCVPGWVTGCVWRWRCRGETRRAETVFAVAEAPMARNRIKAIRGKRRIFGFRVRLVEKRPSLISVSCCEAVGISESDADVKDKCTKPQKGEVMVRKRGKGWQIDLVIEGKRVRKQFTTKREATEHERSFKQAQKRQMRGTQSEPHATSRKAPSASASVKRSGRRAVRPQKSSRVK